MESLFPPRSHTRSLGSMAQGMVLDLPATWCRAMLNDEKVKAAKPREKAYPLAILPSSIQVSPLTTSTRG